jgi:hypothetical protein
MIKAMPEVALQRDAVATSGCCQRRREDRNLESGAVRDKIGRDRDMVSSQAG